MDLFVDCSVAGKEVQSLDSYADNLCRMLEQEYQVQDIRSVGQDNHPLSFGKWKGVLASKVRETIPPSGAYVMQNVAESDIRQIIVEALRPHCSLFVRGAR